MVSIIRRSALYQAELTRLERLAEDASLDIKQRIKSDLNLLSERSVEVIAEDLFQPTKSSHRTNVAFKTLDRAGFNATAAARPGFDQRKQNLNFISLAPLPGDDPEKFKENLKQIQGFLEEQGQREPDDGL